MLKYRAYEYETELMVRESKFEWLENNIIQIKIIKKIVDLERKKKKKGRKEWREPLEIAKILEGEKMKNSYGIF